MKIFDPFCSFLGAVVRDDNGNASSTRLVKLLVFLVVFAVWARISLRSGAMPELPGSIVEILFLLCGYAWAQRKFTEPPTLPAVLANQPQQPNPPTA